MDAPLLSRRDWLSSSGVVLAAAALGVSGRNTSDTTAAELVSNALGGYRFLPGVPALSFGVVAADGFEIVRTTFRQPRPFPAAMADIEQMLRASGRPIHALCALELSSPRSLSRAQFNSFNQAYVARLEQSSLLIGNQVPLARTNVAFARADAAAGEPGVDVHAFSYTVPATSRSRGAAPTFVTAGMPEIRNLQKTALRLEPPDIVAANDTTPEGQPTLTALRLKTEFILTALDETMRTLGVQWTHVTGVQLYTVHDVQPLLSDLILPRIGAAARLGIEWHHMYPPGVRVEIGVRGTHRELVA